MSTACGKSEVLWALEGTPLLSVFRACAEVTVTTSTTIISIRSNSKEPA